MNLRTYPGWIGLHTRDQAPNAMANGSRVVKIKTEPGDSHPVGSSATVLGSLYAPDVGFGYFVEWDARPRYAVFASAAKIESVRLQ